MTSSDPIIRLDAAGRPNPGVDSDRQQGLDAETTVRVGDASWDSLGEDDQARAKKYTPQEPSARPPARLTMVIGRAQTTPSSQPANTDPRG